MKDPEFSKKYLNKLNKKTDAIIKDRFSKNSALAFQQIKNITKYNTFQKRDGGIVEKIKHEGKIITGNEMNSIIMKQFKKMHNLTPNIE